MSEFNESMENMSLSRRDFFKVAAGTTLAVATASVVLPSIKSGRAFAATGNAPAAGTYTVTANVYIDKADTPIGQNAYVTNPGNPPLNKPTSPVTNNATLEVTASGQKLLTVPIVNDTFGVLSIAPVSTDGVVEVVDQVKSSWTPPFIWTTPYAERISSVTFDVTDFEAGGAIATFSPSAEYATFPLYKGDKGWDLHLIADLSAAQ